MAWSLLQVDEGDAIPEDLYEPIAEVLSLVYEMKEEGAGVQDADVAEGPAKDKEEPTTFDPLS